MVYPYQAVNQHFRVIRKFFYMLLQMINKRPEYFANKSYFPHINAYPDLLFYYFLSKISPIDAIAITAFEVSTGKSHTTFVNPVSLLKNIFSFGSKINSYDYMSYESFKPVIS